MTKRTFNSQFKAEIALEVLRAKKHQRTGSSA